MTRRLGRVRSVGMSKRQPNGMRHTMSRMPKTESRKAALVRGTPFCTAMAGRNVTPEPKQKEQAMLSTNMKRKDVSLKRLQSNDGNFHGDETEAGAES